MKKFLLKGLCAVAALVCASGALAINNNNVYAETPSTTMTTVKDDFRSIGIGDSAAIEKVGISASGDKTHGAIPAPEWGSPAQISEEAYLLYELSNGETPFSEFFVSINSQLWNQNSDIAHAENSVCVYIGESKETLELVRQYTAADAPNKIVDDTLDLSEYAVGKTTVYVKVELNQSAVSCESDACANGLHKGCGQTVATPDGFIDIWHYGIKLYEVSISAIEPFKDKEQPIPNDFKSEFPNEIMVDAEYTFPEIVFTDNVDGVVDYYMTMTDPYNISTELGVNATGFFAEYEGLYTFEIRAQDEMGNKYTDKFSLTCVLGRGMPVIYHENVPEKNGRQGIKYTIEPLCYDETAGYTVDIYALDPDGKRVEIVDGGFVPEKVGEYRVVYAATNEVGTTKLLARVYVKYYVGEGNVLEMIHQKENWNGAVKEEEDGLLISGLAYSDLPFSLEEGIKLTFTLPTESDSWVGLFFTRTAGYGLYNFEKETYALLNAAPGLYMLIYKQADGYYCNIDYVGLSGVAMEVVNHAACGTGPDLTVALTKGTEDTIQFFINGVKNENYELNYNVKASVCADNEMFTYLGFGNITHSGALLKSADICDSKAPEIQFENALPETADVGETLNMPVISAMDAHDGEVEYAMKFYSPDGKEVEFIDGKVILSQEGVWYCLVKAEDLSGNKASVVYEIKVGNTEKSTYFEIPSAKSGCGSVINGSVFAAVALLSGAMLVCGKRTKKEDDE